METLRARLMEDYKSALKAGDPLRVSVIRMVRAEVGKEDLAGKGEVDEAGIVAILRRMVRQREESVREFRKGGREDLAAKEEKERAMLQAYLPAEVPDEAIRAAVEEAVTRTGASGRRDMGKVMGAAMAALKGKGTVDGGRVRALVEARLK